MSTFAVGERVIRRKDYRDENPIVQIVARITKTQIVLVGGEKFNTHGKEWGRTGDIYGAIIEPYTDEAWQFYVDTRAERIAATNARILRQACARFVHDLSADEINELYAYLRNKGMPEVKL